MRSEAKPGKRVLVLGDYRQTVTVVRSLARAGCRVILGTDDPNSSTARSRYLWDVWVYDGSSAKRFRDDVEAWLLRERPDFVFVVGESQLRRLGAEAERFAPLALWANAPFAAMARCFDKREMNRLAASLGVPTPAWRDFSHVAHWRAAAGEMGFPVIIKRKDSAAQVRGRKALICSTPGELDAFLGEVHADPEPASLVLQKYASGKRRNCHVGAANGELIAYFEQRVVRTDELDDTGIGVAGVSVAPSPRLRRHCERLTRAVGYDGVGCIQFLVDEATGETAFLEFNARMDSTAALPYRLGYDYPRLALAIAAARQRGERAAGFSAPYATGRKYHWLYGDVYTWVEAARRGKRSPAALAAWALLIAWDASTSYHLTWDKLDPLPTLYQFSRKLIGPALRRFQPPYLRHV